MIRFLSPGPRRDEATDLEITIEVEPVNDAPRVLVDDPFTVEMDEDQEPLIIGTPIDQIFSDPDPGDEIEITWEDDPDGPVALSLDDNEEHIIATIVEENYNGEYDYEITATDTSGEWTTVTLAFNISPVNDAPEVVSSIDNVTIDEDVNPRRVEIADLDSVFTDIDGDVLAYGTTGAPPQLNIDINDDNVLSIEPDDNYNHEGEVEITVIADDGQGGEFMAGFNLDRQGSSIARNMNPRDGRGGSFFLAGSFTSRYSGPCGDSPTAPARRFVVTLPAAEGNLSVTFCADPARRAAQRLRSAMFHSIET